MRMMSNARVMAKSAVRGARRVASIQEYQRWVELDGTVDEHELQHTPSPALHEYKQQIRLSARRPFCAILYDICKLLCMQK